MTRNRQRKLASEQDNAIINGVPAAEKPSTEKSSGVKTGSQNLEVKVSLPLFVFAKCKSHFSLVQNYIMKITRSSCMLLETIKISPRILEKLILNIKLCL